MSRYGRIPLEKKEAILRRIKENGETANKVANEIEDKSREMGNRYTYYRCSKKRGKCDEKYITQEALEEQFQKYLDMLEIDSRFEDWATKWLGYIDKESSKECQKEKDRFIKSIERCKVKFKQFVEMRANGELTKEEFINFKNSLNEEMNDWEQRLAGLKTARENWFSEAKSCLSFWRGSRNVLEKAV